MKFGVREITDVVFRATSVGQKLGNLTTTAAYQPLLFLESAKTSTIESAVATVYAQGGRGNPRLLAWDGDKTVTFTFEDALMSPSSFSALSGADLTNGSSSTTMQLHLTDKTNVIAAGSVNNIPAGSATIGGSSGSFTVTFTANAGHGLAIGDAITTTGFGTGANGTFAVTNVATNAITFALPASVTTSPGTTITSGTFKTPPSVKIAVSTGTVNKLDAGYIKILKLDADGDINSLVSLSSAVFRFSSNNLEVFSESLTANDSVLVDYYVQQNSSKLEISAEKFAGYYYLEANTLFRGTDGKDYPAQFTVPKAKIQSNFTFAMSPTGDPSTFTFTLDAFPASTRFDSTGKKVLFALDIADASSDVI